MSKDALSRITKELEETAKMLKPYKDALAVMRADEYFAKFLEDPLVDHLEIMNNALTKGVFEDDLAHSVSDMLAPYREILGVQYTIESLGKSFSSFIKNDIDLSKQFKDDTVEKFLANSIWASEVQNTLSREIYQLDTSWIPKENNWIVDKNQFIGLDTNELFDKKELFASLCILEKETAQLQTIPDSFVSASSQIASIVSDFETNLLVEDLYSSTRLLEDYCDLAVKQHKLIQRASNQAEVGWRLDVINVVSKYVDRQISWTKQIAGHIDNESNDIDTSSIKDDDYQSGVALIPSHLGYTRKESVDKTPLEGLQESVIVEITEKGKQISEGVLIINQLLLDEGKDRVFSLSETVVRGMMDVGSTVCIGAGQLGIVIDALYFIFYENIEHLKVVIGKGDKANGDAIVREEAIYQCIFNVKTIRNDLRHDLDHGKDSERKLMNVGECYKKYCGGRPIKEKDFKLLQNKLYDEIIVLEKELINLLRYKDDIE